jgi:uncharacterized protein (DUF2236 family)
MESDRSDTLQGLPDFGQPRGPLVASLRSAAAGSTNRLFSDAPDPLRATLSYPGDPGLFGPDSVTWSVMGDVSAFVGGVRALLLQALHPEVLAGVVQHSRYRDDPLGRLSRTSSFVTAMSYGAMPEVETAARLAAAAHQHVSGLSPRSIPYTARTPSLSAWVHNTLTDSFLTAYEMYGPRPLTSGQADLFVSEQTRVGTLMGADVLPDNAADLRSWIATHPDVDRSPDLAETVGFLRRPPLPIAARAPYQAVLQGALSSLPIEALDLLGTGPRRTGLATCKATMAGLRWVLGGSPSWYAALIRMSAPIPHGVFHARDDERTRARLSAQARAGAL